MFDLAPPPPASPEIIVTASRVEQDADATPASVTLIDQDRIERLAPPLVADLLRLVPSLSVAASGPAGSQVQLRIRGAEANHSLLFVEGIRANDPAAGNEPRFELLNANLASRIEVVRGPQSALWGSEAVGGVIAVDGAPPGSGGTLGLAEAGSFDTSRIALRSALGTADRGASIAFSRQRSDGIDSFDGKGDRDGYRNLAGRLVGRYRLSSGLLIGGSGFALAARSDFDGYDPLTFARADTLDFSRSRIAAGRLFAELGQLDSAYARLSASLLGSSNRNDLGEAKVNRTRAGRRTVGIEVGRKFGGHLLILAADSERESFHARDIAYGGLTNQDRSRRRESALVEWRADFKMLQANVAIRHDIFSRFRDATTIRGSLLVPLSERWQLATTYGEGIAQPSFFDLYGFFPGSFVGNPGLKPERSSGVELSLRYRSSTIDAALTAYRQRLRDEIVETPDFTSTRNAPRSSRREGIEFEGGWRFAPGQRLTLAYALLEATAPDDAGRQAVELRRPRHSGSLAVDGELGRWSYGAAIAHSGRHRDRGDSYPYPLVTLDSYWLASARVAYRIARRWELGLRLANAFDQSYQDVAGYRTEGRSIHGSVRFRIGD